MKDRSRFLFLIVCLIIFVPIQFLYSFQFQPINSFFKSTGPESIQTFHVQNTTDKIIAIRISMLTRDVDINGHEINDPADELFVVYPNQIVLRPAAVQKIRVQWKGEKEIDRELNFRIFVEQLPIKFEDSGTSAGSINIMFNYQGTVYIEPESRNPDVILESVERGVNDDGEEGLFLIFYNRGNAHSILVDLSIDIFQDSSTYPIKTFSADQLLGINGENILAGKRRTYFLPASDIEGDGDLHAEIHYTPTR